jgi:hypothetical protein
MHQQPLPAHPVYVVAVDLDIVHGLRFRAKRPRQQPRRAAVVGL